MSGPTKLINATDLKPGMKLALPFKRTATIEREIKVGRDYVTFRTEHGVGRMSRFEEVQIVVPCATTDEHQAHVDLNGECPWCGATE